MIHPGENEHYPAVRDEREWLARPEVWGFDFFVNQVRWRKVRLYQCHVRDKLAACVRCDHCRPIVPRLFSEDFNERFLELETLDLKSWYAANHPDSPGGRGCDGWDVLYPGMRCQVGMGSRDGVHSLKHTAARQLALDRLYSLLHAEPHTPDRVENRVTFPAWRRSLLLDLIGTNPFRQVAFDPAWRTDTAVSLAKGMYESRDFSAMPILADALQEAGCENADVLTHCRDESVPHVRGCWVVDLVLGRT